MTVRINTVANCDDAKGRKSIVHALLEIVLHCTRQVDTFSKKRKKTVVKNTFFCHRLKFAFALTSMYLSTIAQFENH